MTDVETMLEVYKLAQERGKKAGDSVEEELLEVMNKKKEKIKILGTTEQDLDMLTGELRERRFKVLNLKELERQKELNKDD